MAVDLISLEVFKNMFISVAEEMGVALLRTALPPKVMREIMSTEFYIMAVPEGADKGADLLAGL